MHAVPLGLIGSRAKFVLSGNQRGSVLSSHDSGLYCRFENGGVILLHNVRYGVIPFGLGCDVPPKEGWKVFLPGTPVLNDAFTKILTLGGTPYTYAAATMPTPLLPSLPPEIATEERLNEGVAIAVSLLGPQGIAAEYMARQDALFAAEDLPVPFADMWENALWKPLGSLLAFCIGDNSYSPEIAASGLLGLGPGLTPLGDDILCGLLHGAHALFPCFPNRTLSRIIDALAPAVKALAPGATTTQSLAFLASAAAGETFGMLDASLLSLFMKNISEMRRTFAAILAVGHTSGSGLLLGLLLASKLAVAKNHSLEWN